MGQSCDDQWLPQIIDELEAEDPERRQAAAIAAGNVASEDAVDAVAGLLRDEDAEVRYSAVWALGEIGGAEATEILEDLLSETEDADEAETIEEALVAARFKDSPLGFIEDFTDRLN
jgi:HEAT repeat protein